MTFNCHHFIVFDYIFSTHFLSSVSIVLLDFFVIKDYSVWKMKFDRNNRVFDPFDFGVFCPIMRNVTHDYSVRIAVTKTVSILSSCPSVWVGGIDPHVLHRSQCCAHGSGIVSWKILAPAVPSPLGLSHVNNNYPLTSIINSHPNPSAGYLGLL